MKKVWDYVLYLLLLQFVIGQELTTKKVNKLLSRKKRYLLFPKGANFIVSEICALALFLVLPL